MIKAQFFACLLAAVINIIIDVTERVSNHWNTVKISQLSILNKWFQSSQV